MRAANEPATALRAALGSPWPELRDAARALVRGALVGPGAETKRRTFGEAATALGVSRTALERLKRDYPDVFEGEVSRSRGQSIRQERRG